MTISKKMCSSFVLAALLMAMAPGAMAQQAATPTTEATDDLDIAEADATPPAETTAASGESADQSASTERDPTAANPAPADPSLLPVYKEFGEMAGLTALMDDFMVILLADERTRPFFKDADQPKIKKLLAEQFCVILGGPCGYTGRDMKSSHKGLDIGRGHFNALVEDLQIAMDKRGIPFRAQNKLLAKLAPMHREIETK
jgi:hemoglobin